MANTKIIGSAAAENTGNTYTTKLKANGWELTADEPKEYGGNEKGPAPADYLCMALASCKAITIRMYAQRKQWKLDDVNVTAKLVKGDQMASGKNTFFCEVKLSGDLTDEQVKRILEISKVCPVDRLLTKQNEVVTVIE